MDSQVLTLSEAITQVKLQLRDAADSSDQFFRLDNVKIELWGSFAQDTESSMGLKFYVLSVGAKGKELETSGHKITLSLTPKDVTLVGDS